jgi:hypothetical protein
MQSCSAQTRQHLLTPVFECKDYHTHQKTTGQIT